MFQNKILLDCDGVLLDWNAGFREWMKRHDFHEQTDSWYSISKRYGIEIASAKQLVRQFNESAACGFLKPYKDAAEGLIKLADYGYKFEIVTAMSNYEYSQHLRKMNLLNVFSKIKFNRILFVDTGEDKDEILEKNYGNSNCFWIEDKIENAVIGKKVGLRSLLLRNPHHSTETIPRDIPIFDTWSAMVEHITKEDLY